MAVLRFACPSEVVPEIAYDISAVYDHVACDGAYFRRTHNNSVITSVADLEMSAIFDGWVGS